MKSHHRSPRIRRNTLRRRATSDVFVLSRTSWVVLGLFSMVAQQRHGIAVVGSSTSLSSTSASQPRVPPTPPSSSSSSSLASQRSDLPPPHPPLPARTSTIATGSGVTTDDRKRMSTSMMTGVSRPPPPPPPPPPPKRAQSRNVKTLDQTSGHTTDTVGYVQPARTEAVHNVNIPSSFNSLPKEEKVEEEKEETKYNQQPVGNDGVVAAASKKQTSGVVRQGTEEKYSEEERRQDVLSTVNNRKTGDAAATSSSIKNTYRIPARLVVPPPPPPPRPPQTRNDCTLQPPTIRKQQQQQQHGQRQPERKLDGTIVQETGTTKTTRTQSKPLPRPPPPTPQVLGHHKGAEEKITHKNENSKQQSQATVIDVVVNNDEVKEEGDTSIETVMEEEKQQTTRNQYQQDDEENQIDAAGDANNKLRHVSSWSGRNDMLSSLSLSSSSPPEVSLELLQAGESITDDRTTTSTMLSSATESSPSSYTTKAEKDHNKEVPMPLAKTGRIKQNQVLQPMQQQQQQQQRQGGPQQLMEMSPDQTTNQLVHQETTEEQATNNQETTVVQATNNSVGEVQATPPKWLDSKQIGEGEMLGHPPRQHVKPTSVASAVRTMPAPPLPRKPETMPARPASASTTTATYHAGGRTPPTFQHQPPQDPRQFHQYGNQYDRGSRSTNKKGGSSPHHRTCAANPNARGPTSYNSSSKGGAPVFRSVWSKVEQGLDKLANIEDAITGRAQQIVSTAVPKTFRRQLGRSEAVQPSQQPKQAGRARRPRKRGPTSESLVGPQMRWQQQQKLDAEKQQKATQNKDAASGSFQPAVSFHQFNSSTSTEGGRAAADATSGLSVPKGSRSAPTAFKATKLMPANGGASSPSDNSNWNYPGQTRFSSTVSPSQANTANPSEQSTTKDTLSTSVGGEGQGIDSGKEQLGSAGPPGKASPLQQQQVGGGPSEQIRSPFGTIAPRTGSISPSRPLAQRGDGNWSQQRDGTMRHGPPGSHSPRSAAAAAAAAGTGSRVPRSVPAKPVSRPPIFPDDDDDDETASLLSRLIGLVPVPPIGKLFRLKQKHGSYASFDAWDAEDEDDKKSRGVFGFFNHGRDTSTVVPAVAIRKQASSSRDLIVKPAQKLMERSKNGETPSLLTAEDKKFIRGLGKSRAIFDVLSLVFFLVGVRQLHGLETIPFPHTLAELGSLTLPNLVSVVGSSGETWALLAFAAAMLTAWTNSLLFSGRIQRKAEAVATAAESEASYARLFVRLVLSTPTDRDLPEKFFQAALLQVVALADLSRLRSFIVYTISTILLMTVAFIKPLLLTLVGSIIHIITLREWWSWPIPTDIIWANVVDTSGGVGHELKSLMEIELQGAGHHPMQVAFKASILGALLAVAWLPTLEHKRSTNSNIDPEEEDSNEAVQKMAERLSNLGASSAGRLGILSKSGWLESLVERWSLLKDEFSTSESDVPVGALFRRVGYYVASWVLLAAPVLLFGFLGTPMTGWSADQMPRWESLLEVCVLLLFTNKLLWNTIGKIIDSTNIRPEIVGLLKSVSEASSEMVRHSVSPQPFSSSPNPTAGLVVRDLWAAHEVKRAWAIRAAHLVCRNGEVLVVLGDDGAGKSRLLTTIAESILLPPKGALTARIQRGSVSLGGIDITKWDRNQLRKRVGILLNDVNSLSNMAGIWSGLSLEEILEPGDGLKLADPTHTSSSVEKSCMIRALKLTGLYWSLLPRLPTKLSSVLTANEEDLRPSPIRPRYHVLSPTEWSKLMLAKLLAQALYDNENSSGSNDKLDNSLVGSLFLLDESTQLLSEIEEAKLLRDLRRTGVAIVLSSNKWATGRLADRIVVMKDGTIIESGTHNELLSRGPQQSVYAAKWHALSSF